MNLKQLLNEIEFNSQASFDAYKKAHKMRDTTKVNVAGKETTAGAASKKSATPKEEPKKSETPSKSKRKWVNFDKEHSIDTNSGVIVPKGKESDTPNPKDIKGIDSIDKPKAASKSARKWVNFDKDHSIDTNSGVIVTKGKESDNPDAKDIKGIDRISEPAKKRPGNPKVNKEAKAQAEKFGITPQKLGNDGYKKAMYQAAVEALTDANFHDEARELVASIEGKPEWAKKVNYPSMDDPKYKEKMADIRKNGVDSSEYWDSEGDAHELGRKVSQASGWGGVEAADGIAFALRMNGFHREADKIQSIFDNKGYMKNESLRLKSVMNEAKFETYHDSYTSAINAAKEWAEKSGYEIDDEDSFRKIGMGPRKPSEGKTNKFSIELTKGGKPQRKQLHIQVYGMKTKYELNCYIG